MNRWWLDVMRMLGYDTYSLTHDVFDWELECEELCLPQSGHVYKFMTSGKHARRAQSVGDEPA